MSTWSFHRPALALSAGILVLMGVLSGLAPGALRAARLDRVEALRYE